MTLVRWVRHGQNEANVTRTLSHRTCDPDLTDLGRRQARDAATGLAGLHPPAGALVCSPLRRARQTADVVAGRLGLAVAAELEDLREIDVGTLDGRRDADAWRVYDAVLAAWARGDLTARFPGGEDGAELVRRVRRALAAAVRQAVGEPAGDDPAGLDPAGLDPAVLVVAHGGNLRAALPGLTGRPAPGADLRTGGWATLDVRVDGHEVEVLDWMPDRASDGP